MKKNSIPALLLIALLLITYAGAKVYGQSKARQIMDDQVEQLAPFAEVTYSDINFDPLTFKSRAKGISIASHDSSFSAEIAEVIINRYDTRNEPPHYSDTEIKGMIIDFSDPAALSPGMAQAGATLDMLGYNSITMDISSSHSFDLKNKSLNETVTVDVADMGSLDMSLSLGELDISQEAAMQMLFTYPLIKVNRARLHYEDNSLAKRVIGMIASQRDITPDELTKNTTEMLDALLVTEKEAIAITLMKAMKTYINNPGYITLSLAPQPPVTIAELTPLTLEQILEKLNFSIQL